MFSLHDRSRGYAKIGAIPTIPTGKHKSFRDYYHFDSIRSQNKLCASQYPTRKFLLPRGLVIKSARSTFKHLLWDHQKSFIVHLLALLYNRRNIKSQLWKNWFHSERNICEYKKAERLYFLGISIKVHRSNGSISRFLNWFQLIGTTLNILYQNDVILLDFWKHDESYSWRGIGW